jgi:hypothetical protein
LKPSIGRTVHYVSFGTPGGEYSRECRAAIITEVNHLGDGTVGSVGLCVLNPTGQFFNRAVPLHSGNEDRAGGTNLCGALDFPGGTWHWPEHVPAPKAEILESR